MTNLVLNQYRHGSSYKDVVGKLYHFPIRYLKAFSDLPSSFVYYEPREGGEQVYFGAGIVLSVYDDTEDVGHAYAEIGGYREFATNVDFYSNPRGGTWENAKTMRNSVRRLGTEELKGILNAGGIAVDEIFPSGEVESSTEALNAELKSLSGGRKLSPPVLRRIRRILESYERPSRITNHVKRTRGDSCQICGVQGFLKRDGTRYCEVHHLFHLADVPPSDCLLPEYLIVLCANCHRKMHYGAVGQPIATSDGWAVKIEGNTVAFRTRQ